MGSIDLFIFYIDFSRVKLPPYLDNFAYIVIGLIIIISVIPILLPQKKNKSNRSTAVNNKRKNNSTKRRTLNNNLLRSDSEIMSITLKELSWREFERLCFLYYKEKGYEPRETKDGADGGVDLIIFDKKHNTDIAVQIKHYKSGNPITVGSIRELNSARRNHNCGLANFITTSRFTRDAQLQADKFNIETYDINWVENKIIKWKEKR